MSFCFNQRWVDCLTVIQQTSCSTLKNLLCGDKQSITLCLVKSVRPNDTSPFHNSTQFDGSVQAPLAREWTPKSSIGNVRTFAPVAQTISIDVNRFSQVRLQSQALPIENGWISQQNVCQLCLDFALFFFLTSKTSTLKSADSVLKLQICLIQFGPVRLQSHLETVTLITRDSSALEGSIFFFNISFLIQTYFRLWIGDEARRIRREFSILRLFQEQTHTVLNFIIM